MTENEPPRYVLDDDPENVPFPLVTRSGRVLTDQDIEAMAVEAERGYDFTIKPQQAAAMLLRALERREAFWRERVGDEDYERAVEHWRGQAEA